MQLNLSLCTKERFLLLRFGMMIDDLIYKQASAVRHFSPADCSKITVFNSRHEIGKIPVKIQRYSSPLFTAAVRKNFISSAVAMFRSSDVSVVIIIPLSKEKSFQTKFPNQSLTQDSKTSFIIYGVLMRRRLNRVGWVTIHQTSTSYGFINAMKQRKHGRTSSLQPYFPQVFPEISFRTLFL